MLELGTAVDCNKEGHCLHEGTAVGSLYCCKCGQYIQYGFPFSYTEYIEERKAEIDAHPEWGITYL